MHGVSPIGAACMHLRAQFVATRIKPVLRKARETEFVDLVKETTAYLKVRSTLCSTMLVGAAGAVLSLRCCVTMCSGQHEQLWARLHLR